MKIIGAANDFWRVRLTRVDSTESADFEWREDILYRTPPETEIQECERWRVEAVRLDDFESVVTIGAFDERDDAETLLDRVREDLADMTKTQFEDAYLSSPPLADTSDDQDCR